MQTTAPKKKTQISFLIRDEFEPRHRSFVNSIQLDPVDGYLFSAGSDSAIRKWDVRRISQPKAVAEQHVKVMDHHCDWVNDIILISKNTRLVSASTDTTVKIWNAVNSTILSTLRTHKDSVRCLAYSCGTAEIVGSAGLDKSICLWDVNTLTKVSTLNNTITASQIRGIKNSIYSLAMNAHGTVVISGSTENVVRVWDTRTCQKVAKLRGHSDNIRAIAVNRDGTMCLSASSDGAVRVWSIGQERCIGSIRCHSDSVWALQMDAAFSFVLSGGRDHRVFRTPLCNLSNNELLFIDEQPIQKLMLDDADRPTNVWSATWSSTIRRWPLQRPDGVDIGGSGGVGTPSVNGHYVENVAPVSGCLSPSASSNVNSNGVGLDGPLRKNLVREPNIILPGAPSIRKYVVLNDKRHVVTRDTDDQVQMWDVLQARRVRNFGRVTIEDVVRDNYRRVFVPSWFGVDAKCGSLEITLDEADVFSAWVSAKDANFPDMPPDAKLNYGGMILKSLFEQWPLACVDNHEETPLHGFFSIPSHTPIIIRHITDELAPRPMHRCTVGEAASAQESVMLRDHLPGWVVEVVQNNHFPKFNKIPFVLLPHVTFPTKIVKKDRLSATEMLQVRKVMEHVYEKILYPNMMVAGGGPNATAECGGASGGGGGSGTYNTASESGASSAGNSGASPPPPPPPPPMTQIPANIEEKIELFCNDQKLDPEMDLRTVKHFIWKQGSDLLIYYRPLR